MAFARAFVKTMQYIPLRDEMDPLMFGPSTMTIITTSVHIMPNFQTECFMICIMNSALVFSQ